MKIWLFIAAWYRSYECARGAKSWPCMEPKCWGVCSSADRQLGSETRRPFFLFIFINVTPSGLPAKKRTALTTLERAEAEELRRRTGKKREAINRRGGWIHSYISDKRGWKEESLTKWLGRDFWDAWSEMSRERGRERERIGCGLGI